MMQNRKEVLEEKVSGQCRLQAEDYIATLRKNFNSVRAPRTHLDYALKQVLDGLINNHNDSGPDKRQNYRLAAMLCHHFDYPVHPRLFGQNGEDFARFFGAYECLPEAESRKILMYFLRERGEAGFPDGERKI